MSRLQQTFQLIRSGDYAAAAHVLGTEAGQDGIEWWRMKALLLNSQQKREEAVHTFENGAHLLEDASASEKARFHHDYGGHLLNLNRYQEAVTQLSAVHGFAAQARDIPVQFSAAYNLAWAYLQVGKNQQASDALEKQLSLALRSGGSSYRHLIHAGRCLVAQTQGDPHLALARAQFAIEAAPDEALKARGTYLKGIALKILGEDASAHSLMTRVATAASGGDLARRAAFMLALWNGQQADPVDDQDTCRALCYAAQHALNEGESEHAREALRQAAQLGNPFTLNILGQLLPELRAWSAEQVALFPEVSQPSREIIVKARGNLFLQVNGYPVRATLSPRAATVLTALIQARQLMMPLGELENEVRTGSRKHLLTALDQIRGLIGDPDAVQIQQEGSYSVASLAKTWNWKLDLSGQGRVLGGHDSPVAERIHLQFC